MLSFNVIVENPIFLILILTGFIFCIVGLIIFKYPPKSINYLYGYRTSSSMKSQERWNFAQVYSAKKLIQSGFVLMFIASAGCFYSFPGAFGVIASLLLMVVCVAFMVVKTEKELRMRFK